MENRATMAFRVCDKGGPSGGKTLSRDYPAFDLALFMKTPNVEEYIRKHYLATVKKIIREIDEGKNGTHASDLNSFETVVARSLSFTKDEIADWMRTRDWQRATQVKDMTKLRPALEKHLPALANRRHPFPEEKAAELADKVIAAVADDPDPVADFLFTTLTAQRDDGLSELFTR